MVSPYRPRIGGRIVCAEDDDELPFGVALVFSGANGWNLASTTKTSAVIVTNPTPSAIQNMGLAVHSPVFVRRAMAKFSPASLPFPSRKNRRNPSLSNARILLCSSGSSGLESFMANESVTASWPHGSEPGIHDTPDRVFRPPLLWPYISRRPLR